MKRSFDEILENDYHVQLEDNRRDESIKLAAEKYASQSAGQGSEGVLVEYIYSFAWNYGRFYHLGNAEKIIAAVSERIQLPEEFLSKPLPVSPSKPMSEGVYGECAKHPGNNLANCIHCASDNAQLREGEVEDGFIEYMTNARNEFVNDINKQGWRTALRLTAENFLICFDQMRERLLPNPPKQ